MSPTAGAHTPTVASGTADGSHDAPGRRRAAGWAGLLLLMAVAAGLLGHRAASAEIFGCNNVVCGSETDSEVIEIRR